MYWSSCELLYFYELYQSYIDYVLLGLVYDHMYIRPKLKILYLLKSSI